MPPIRPADAADAPAIRVLLLDAGLPVDDLAASDIAFFVADDAGGLVGVVGVESFGRAGLLRSLAVASSGIAVARSGATAAGAGTSGVLAGVVVPPGIDSVTRRVIGG